MLIWRDSLIGKLDYVRKLVKIFALNTCKMSVISLSFFAICRSGAACIFEKRSTWLFFILKEESSGENEDDLVDVVASSDESEIPFDCEVVGICTYIVTYRVEKFHLLISGGFRTIIVCIIEVWRHSTCSEPIFARDWHFVEKVFLLYRYLPCSGS